MTIFQTNAHAKINLFLHVTGRRENGYHELDSLAVFAPVADRLRVEELSTRFGVARLTIEGPFSEGLTADGDNLVMRAAALLREECTGIADLPDLVMTLDKRLPVASGIGGGSADAAAALRLVARAWGREMADLRALAARLGADVPVCLAGEPCRMQGIGERLLPAPELPPFAILLVNPGIAVPTPAVFAALRQSGAAFRAPATLPSRWNDLAAMCANLRETANDLQAPAIGLFPGIATVIDAIIAQPGCQFARMSGSGATCFGLFEREEDARAASVALSTRGWWTDAGKLPTLGDTAA